MDIKVHDIGGYALRNYILETSRGIIAIDTGYKDGFDKFIKRFTQKWDLKDLKYIFLTHHHDDHAGFLGEIMKITDAKVILHPLAIDPLSKGESQDDPNGGYSSFPASIFGWFKKEFKFPPVDLGDRAILAISQENCVFKKMDLPIEIVFLPGHTPDSIGIYLTDTKELFCGDAAMNAIISVAKHTIWIDNVDNFRKSWDVMISLDPKKIYPSHGNPFSVGELIKYKDYMVGRKLIKVK